MERGWVNIPEWWVNIKRNGGSTCSGIYSWVYKKKKGLSIRDNHHYLHKTLLHAQAFLNQVYIAGNENIIHHRGL